QGSTADDSEAAREELQRKVDAKSSPAPPESIFPRKHCHRLPWILSNLGLVDRDQNRMSEARQAFEQALRYYRELVRKNPDAYLPNLAMTLNNLGLVDRDRKST